MPRITDSRPLSVRISEAIYDAIAVYASSETWPASDAADMAFLSRASALQSADNRRRATLAAWDRAVALFQAAQTDPDPLASLLFDCDAFWITGRVGLASPLQTSYGL